MPSYFKVFPQSLGTFRGSRGDPADHIFDIPIPLANGQVALCHVEVLFRAVNDLDVEEFFRGLEATAFWLPEADTNGDLDAVLSLASNRAGRYPEPDDRPAGDPAFKGVFGDANAPMINTPFHRRFYMKLMADGKPAPASDRLFVQPSGFSPNAENLFNLRKISKDYYGEMAAQLASYDVQRLLHNKPGFGRHGDPVHPNFDEALHVATRPIDEDPHSMVVISVDAGSGALIPAAAFSQRRYSGQWAFGAEIWVKDGQMTTPQLGQGIRETMNRRYPNCKNAVICIDPAAAARNAQTEYTTAQHLQEEAGIEVILAPTNANNFRRNALDSLFLARVAGSPRDPMIIIDRECEGLIQGLAGGFHYPRRAGVLSTTPAKNRFSHIVEAAEYGPLTIDGVDAREGRFIRPDGFGGEDANIKAVLPD